MSIDALYFIAAGAEDVECRFKITPLSLTRIDEIGAGIRHLPKMRAAAAPGWLGIEGEQDPAIGPLGFGLYFDPGTISSVGDLETHGIANDVISFRKRLEPGHAVTGRYRVAAAWSGSGIHNLLDHLGREEQRARATVVVEDLRHTSTPEPQRLEGERF